MQVVLPWRLGLFAQVLIQEVQALLVSRHQGLFAHVR